MPTFEYKIRSLHCRTNGRLLVTYTRSICTIILVVEIAKNISRKMLCSIISYSSSYSTFLQISASSSPSKQARSTWNFNTMWRTASFRVPTFCENLTRGHKIWAHRNFNASPLSATDMAPSHCSYSLVHCACVIAVERHNHITRWHGSARVF